MYTSEPCVYIVQYAVNTDCQWYGWKIFGYLQSTVAAPLYKEWDFGKSSRKRVTLFVSFQFQSNMIS